MFSWICKICGRDNPPSTSSCLSCGARFDAEPESATPAGKPSSQPPTSQPIDEDVAQSMRGYFAEGAPSGHPSDVPTQQTDPQPTYAPSSVRAPVRDLPPRPVKSVSAASSGLPTWLMMILVFFAIVGVGAGVYYGWLFFSNRKQATSTGLDPAANTARTKLSNPLQKYVEVVGIRFVQDAKRKPEARFIIVNHSPNTLDELSATVTLWASTSRSEEDSTGTFTVKVPPLPPYGAKELTSPLNTKLKFYELPDWQNITPELQITSP